MLYLFASGFRKAYKVALLNAACAPVGSSQTFTYSLGKNISQRAYEAIETTRVGSSVLLVFIDRFANGGYQYVAMRNAELLELLLDSKQVEITIRFGNWPKEGPANSFSPWVRDTLVPLGAPRLSESPQNENDGDYAVVGLAVPTDLFDPDDGWRSLVERLSQAQVLQTSDTQTVIFARLDVLEAQTNSVAEWHRPWRVSTSIARLLGNRPPNPALRLKRSLAYRARVTYFFPLQNTNTDAEVPFNLVPSSGLQPSSSLVGNAAALARAEMFPFRIAALSPTSRESLLLQFGPVPGEVKTMLAPRIELPIGVAYSAKFLLYALGIGAVWVGASGWLSQTTSHDGLFRWGFYGAPFLQYVAVLAMFRLFGTKIA